MRGWVAAVLGLVLVGTLTPAGTFGATYGREERDELTTAYRGRGFHLDWDESRGLPRKLVNLTWADAQAGPGGDSAEAVAEAFLRAHAVTLFGTDAVDVAPRGEKVVASGLFTTRTRQSLSGSQVVKRQRHRGVPVLGAAVQVNLDRRGEVRSVLSSFVPDIDLDDVEPLLTAGDAVAAALAAIDRPGSTRQAPEAQLVVSVESGTPRLAYRTEIALWSPFGVWVSLVDAMTGEVLSVRDIIVCRKRPRERLDLAPPASTVESSEVATPGSPASSVTGVGFVLPVNPLNGHPERYGMRDGDDVDQYRVREELHRLDGSGWLRGAYADVTNDDAPSRAYSPNFVFEYSAMDENSAFHEVNAYWHVDTFQNYMRSALNILNAVDRPQALIVHRTEYENSWYDPSDSTISFGDGGVDDSEDGEIILHEYGHALHDDISGIGGLQSSAISEGFGDYLGATLGGNALVGEWDATAYNPGPPPFLRRTDGTKHYPNDLTGQLHQDGEIISSAWWNLRAMVGAELADQLVIESFFWVGEDITMPDVADATVQVDLALYGGAHLAPILTAYGDRGILPSFRLAIDHTPLSDTQTVGPYPVAVAIAHSAPISQPDAVQLHWKRLNDAEFQSVTLVAAGADQWTGELPFTGAQAAIRYYITATDDDGITAFYPTLAPDQLVGFVVGTGVPVLAVGLRAAQEDAGVQVSWELNATEGIQGLHVVRSVNGSPFARVSGEEGLKPTLGPMSYLDPGHELVAGDELVYRLESVWETGRSEVLAGETRLAYAPAVPSHYALEQNSPNPFNPRTVITFTLPREGHTMLGIYDLAGRRVAALVDEVLPAATHRVEWDGTDDRGVAVSSGSYFYRLRSGTFLRTRKMILMK